MHHNHGHELLCKHLYEDLLRPPLRAHPAAAHESWRSDPPAAHLERCVGEGVREGVRKRCSQRS